MRKKSLFVFALAAFMAMSASAQTFVKGTAKIERNNAVLTLPQKNKAKKAAKAEGQTGLAANQKYVGFTMPSTVPDPNQGVGMPNYPNDNSAAASLLTKDLVSKYEGCKIVGMRFALCSTIGSTNVFVIPIDAQGNINDPVLQKEVKSTEVGWNTVMFDNPYTISTSTLSGYLVGFEYAQKGTNSQESYPLAASGSSDGAIYLYNNLGKGEGWYGVQGAGDLMVQLIVEREGGFAAYDLSLDGLVTLPYAKQGGESQLQLVCHNSGTGSVDKATFGLKLDGEKLGSFAYNKEIAGDQVAIPVTFDVPEGYTIGDHKLEAYVETVQEQEPDPTSDLTDDNAEATFRVYDESMNRQKQLVEQMTSQWCLNCPYGYNVLNKLADKRNDLVWVSLHSDYSGKSDDYKTQEGEYLSSLLTAAFPSAAFNRYYYGDTSMNPYGTVAMAIGYPAQYQEQAAEFFNELIDYSAQSYPSFSSIDIASNYDKATSKASVKVSGRTVKDFEQSFGKDAVLTVYLIEDGLTGKQKMPTGMTSPKYSHPHVVRKVVSGPLGDKLVLNGNTFEMDYSDIDIDSEWNADNMSVVAFVSRPITGGVDSQGYVVLTSDVDDAWVDNTETVKLGQTVTGIANIDANGKAVTEVARYTVDGQRIAQPVKGLNIVKMSNGQTLKVLVK